MSILCICSLATTLLLHRAEAGFLMILVFNGLDVDVDTDVLN